ncbi:hypothetical protein ACWDKQ_30040 [Saccharopolyspora sp. NPDC000995]
MAAEGQLPSSENRVPSRTGSARAASAPANPGISRIRHRDLDAGIPTAGSHSWQVPHGASTALPSLPGLTQTDAVARLSSGYAWQSAPVSAQSTRR